MIKFKNLFKRKVRYAPRTEPPVSKEEKVPVVCWACNENYEHVKLVYSSDDNSRWYPPQLINFNCPHCGAPPFKPIEEKRKLFKAILLTHVKQHGVSHYEQDSTCHHVDKLTEAALRKMYQAPKQ